MNLRNLFARATVLISGLVLSMTLATSQIKMLESGTGKDVDPNKQEVYGAGGETKLNRITDLEKSVDYVKGRLQEIDELKKRVEELEKLLNKSPGKEGKSPSAPVPAPAASAPSNMFLRK